MACKTCGGTMVGDGYTLVRHCEFVDVSGGCFEPDAGPIYCTMSDEPESTEQNRVWHSGPPPHVGWWQASASWNPRLWRWWNGTYWSLPVRKDDCAREVEFASKTETPIRGIEWNDYWPTNARVPRLAPEDFEIGARWVCVEAALLWEFKGLEFTVVNFRDDKLILGSYRGFVSTKINYLPRERYVPSRCVGPQTRWDFPMPKEPCHG